MFHDTNELLEPEVAKMMTNYELFEHLKNKTLSKQN